jgi:hypothetical protein
MLVVTLFSLYFKKEIWSSEFGIKDWYQLHKLTNKRLCIIIIVAFHYTLYSLTPKHCVSDNNMHNSFELSFSLSELAEMQIFL